MKQLPVIVPHSLNKLIQTAEMAYWKRDFQSGIQALQEASRIVPDDISVLCKLGHFHGMYYDYEAAGDCFERALELSDSKIETLAAISGFCQDFYHPALRERYLIKLLKAFENTSAWPQICVELVRLYERSNRLSEAIQLMEKLLNVTPAYPAALLMSARLERRAGRLETAEQVLRSFINKPVPLAWTHAQSWYELATVLDRMGKYDEAMTAFLNAKALLKPQASRYLDTLKNVRAFLKVMETNVSADMLRRWFENSPNLTPSRRLCLLCGHARSGTTLLEQVLDSHPDIVSAEETPVFLDDAYLPLRRGKPPNAQMLSILEEAALPQLQQSRTAYFRSTERLIGAPVGNRLLLDKNPVLTYLIPAFIRIFPETKFIIALRDPRDVVLSCFMQPHKLNEVTAAYLSLDGTVEDYMAVMSIWRTLAPQMPSPCLEVRYKDIVEDLESVVRKILGFLDLPFAGDMLKFHEKAGKKVIRSPSYADVIKPIYKSSRGRWRNYQKYLEPYLEKLSPYVKAFGFE